MLGQQLRGPQRWSDLTTSLIDRHTTNHTPLPEIPAATMQMKTAIDQTHLRFEPSSALHVHTAAQQMQGSSLFVAAVTDLQLPRLLAPSQLRRLAKTDATGGRFVRWELCGEELWLQCALDAGPRCQPSLALAAGVPSCRVGSVARIEAAQRKAFLAAVVTAFPLTDQSTFLCRLLDAEQVLATVAAPPTAATAAAVAAAAPVDEPKLHSTVAAKRGVVPKVAPKAKGSAPCHFYSKGA